MSVRESGHQAKNLKWDKIVMSILPGSYIANSQDLLWAVDTNRKLVFANDAYLNFIYNATGDEVYLDTYSLSPDGNKEMSDKWDYFYTRALNGEHFHIITNFASQRTEMIVDANFMPLISDGHILGTACLARTTSSMILPSVDIPGDERENTSFHSPS